MRKYLLSLILVLVLAFPAWGQMAGDATRLWNRPIAQTAPTDGQVLGWDGTAKIWKACVAVLGADPAGCTGGQATTDINAAGVSTCTAWTANVLTLLGAADYAAFKASLSLQNVTNESKATMFTSPTFTGTVTMPTGGTGAVPLKLVSGTVATTPVAGAFEFTTDALYFTTTTGPTRKTIAFLDSNITGTAANLSGTPTLPSGTTLVAPVLGTPASGTLTNTTGYPGLAITAGKTITVTQNTALDEAVAMSSKLAIPGAWTTPGYSAGDFTCNESMTWTVEAGDVTVFAYTIVGKTMTVAFQINDSTVGGTLSNTLQIKIPAAKTATKIMYGAMGRLVDNSVVTPGFCFVAAAGTNIGITRQDIGNYTASTNATHVYGQITFEIN